MTYLSRVLACLALAMGPASGAEILVAAAANLNGVAQELALQFQKQSGIKVIFSFSSTGNLARQIENSAPFDVFLAADTTHLIDLERKTFIVPGTRAVYARGRLVLWSNSAGISSLNDLTRKWVRYIALAQPDSAPYGAAALETLHRLNLWDQLRPKLVYAENINMARQYAITGNAEAAFTAYSLVIQAGGHVLMVDERLHQPIEQALGIVKGCKNPDGARRFTQFVLSPASAGIWEQYGYLAPVR